MTNKETIDRWADSIIRLPSDIAACYEAMREQAARNAKFDILGFIRKRMVQVTEKEK